MNPEQLSAAIVHALEALVQDGSLSLPDGVPATVVVERPRNREHGDYATNVALQLAKKAGVPPRDLATLLAAELAEADGIAGADIAGPGFLNIRVEAGAQGAVAAQVVEAGAAYGTTRRWPAPASTSSSSRRTRPARSTWGTPAGPWSATPSPGSWRPPAPRSPASSTSTTAATRWTSSARRSRRSRWAGRCPRTATTATTSTTSPRQVVEENPHILDLPEGERMVAFREAGYKLQLAEQQEQLGGFRTNFDVWFSERSLYDEDKVARSLDKLRDQGHLYDADGALWMRTTDFGDDKDRVLVRSNGELTYFASDTAYYVDKRERGFDVCLYLLGADHHGYVGRLKAMAACTGDDPSETLEVLIGQLVKILRGGEEIRLSKRAGTIVTLQELVELIGVDALRYTLARYPADSPLTLDVEQITRQATDNPVFYVQYAHARLSAVLRNGADLGLTPPRGDAFDPALLAHEREGELLRALAEFPRVVATAAELREPHRVARYLEDTAATFHRFYDACRVLPMGDEEPAPIHRARLLLVDATRTVFANGLRLLGVTAPERM